MPQNLRDTVRQIGQLNDAKPLIDFLRCWMDITDLDFKDAIHLSYPDLLDALRRVSTKLSDSVDLFDEDQLQEAACRCLKSITVYGDMITDRDVAVRQSQRIEWDGTAWHYMGDPTLRKRAEASSYRDALEAVKQSLGV